MRPFAKTDDNMEMEATHEYNGVMTSKDVKPKEL